jgi:hypothetical protein
MFPAITVGVVAAPALRQRVCLFEPSMTVFPVVYVRLMTCVCTTHDWRATCSLIRGRRAVAVRHVQT